MDFTREPVIETIISPREGHRLVVRSSKNSTQEEYFVDAVEVVTFGSSCFFRSKEKPKPFLVPVSDYEVVEVREQRLVIKARTPEGGSIKIAGGRESRENNKNVREERKPENSSPEEKQPENKSEGRFDRKGNRRNRLRKPRREEASPMPVDGQVADEAPLPYAFEDEMPVSSFEEPKAQEHVKPAAEDVQNSDVPAPAPIFRAVLPPPTTLIRDDLQRLRETASGAFYNKEEVVEPQPQQSEEKKEVPPQEGSFCPPPANENGPLDNPPEDIRG